MEKKINCSLDWHFKFASYFSKPIKNYQQFFFYIEQIFCSYILVKLVNELY